MSALQVPPLRPVHTVRLQNEEIAAGGVEGFIHTVRGSRLGISVRLEAAGDFAINVQPYSPLSESAYAVGLEMTIYEAGGSLFPFGSAFYVPSSGRVLVRVRNRGSSSITVRGVFITDFPA